MSQIQQKTRQMTIKEAQRALGASRSTIERRIKRHALTGHKHAGKWVIDVPIEEIKSVSDTAKTVSDIAPDEVTKLTQQVSDLTQQLDGVRAEIDRIAAERDEATQQVVQQSVELAAARAELEAVRAERDRLVEQLADASRRLDDMMRQNAQLTATVFQMTAQRALPAPGKRRAWWRFWQRDEGEQGEG